MIDTGYLSWNVPRRSGISERSASFWDFGTFRLRWVCANFSEGIHVLAWAWIKINTIYLQI